MAEEKAQWVTMLALKHKRLSLNPQYLLWHDWLQVPAIPTLGNWGGDRQILRALWPASLTERKQCTPNHLVHWDTNWDSRQERRQQHKKKPGDLFWLLHAQVLVYTPSFVGIHQTLKHACTHIQIFGCIIVKIIFCYNWYNLTKLN